MKSRQISNIHMHGLLSKCKNHLNLPMDRSKSAKKTIKTLSWNLGSKKLSEGMIQMTTVTVMKGGKG